MYILYKTIKRYPIIWFLKYVKNIFFSYIISYRLHGFSFLPRVIFDIEVFSVQIYKSKKGYIKCNSYFSFIFQNFQGGNTVTRIVILDNSILEIGSVFYLGNGVKIIVEKNASLRIGGSKESISGITCDSIISVFKKIEIGVDSIISWGVYISDSSQHFINDKIKIDEIVVGDNVWISEGSTIGPGVQIGSGSIVGSKAFLNSIYENNSLIAGIPAKIKKRGITWRR
jgi:acetyltransferase-like isoleucine patch superfamily enzyme